jgi:hypothetical protein
MKATASDQRTMLLFARQSQVTHTQSEEHPITDTSQVFGRYFGLKVLPLSVLVALGPKEVQSIK